jgi:hypothetical protein
MAQPKKKRKPVRKQQRLARWVAILIIFGLIASFFIGSIGTLSASAASLPTTTYACVPDVDGDGALNAVDEDIDGDGTVNGLDDDMDGDKLANFDDSDPAETNCKLDSATPLAPPVEQDSTPAFIAATIIGISVSAPVAYFVAKRKRR